MTDVSTIKALKERLSALSDYAATLEKEFATMSKAAGKIATETQKLRVHIAKGLNAPPATAATHLKSAQKDLLKLRQGFEEFKDLAAANTATLTEFNELIAALAEEMS